MNSKMLIKHTRIEINDYDIGDAPMLEYLFTVDDRMKSKPSTILGMEYDEANRKLILPRGMDIDYLKNTFSCEPRVDTHCDEYVNTDPIPIKYLTKDDKQKEILMFLLGKDKYKYTLSKSQLSCNSSTGSGKTFVTVAYMCYTGSRGIIIANSIDWLKQWRDRILEYTPLEDNDIYDIVGSGSINKLLNRDPLRYKIFLVSHSTIRSYGEECGWDRVSELFKYMACSVKVYDEAHLYFDNIAKIDFHTNIRKTIYLTATPARSSKQEDLIYQMYFKNIPSISLFDESDPHVNYIAMHYNSHPSLVDVKNTKSWTYGLDRNKYVNYVVTTDNFEKLLIILVDMFYNKDGKCLMYVGTNSSITYVYNTIITHLPFLKDHIGIYTSVVDKAQKEENLKKKFILSTTKSCGAASDIKDLKCVINLAEPFKSKVLAVQTLGRCRENDSVYIDAVDNGFYHTKNYYKAKKPIFSVHAKSCKDVKMDDALLEERYNKVLEKYNSMTPMCHVVYKK